MNVVRNLVSWMIRGMGFCNSIPFRLFGAKLAWSSSLGPGYSLFGCHLENVVVEPRVMIGSRAWIQTVPIPGRAPPRIVIGEGTSIGRNVVFSAARSIVIGKKCMLSYNVSILDSAHQYEDTEIPPTESGITEGAEIVIGDHCFIGAHSFIMPGVTLGRHCVVGANSVVTHSFSDHAVIAGSPAKLIRYLNGTSDAKASRLL